MDDVILKSDGFYARDWNSERGDYDVSPLPLDERFFTAWRVTVKVDPGVRFRDLVAVLRAMSDGTRRILGYLTRTEIDDYLAEVADARKASSLTGDDPLEAIEVYRAPSVDNHAVVDPVDDQAEHWVFEDYPSAHGVSKSASGERKEWGISFCSWPKLLDLELRLAEATTFTTTRWRKRDVPVVVIEEGVDGPAITSKREFDRVETINLAMTYTLGDFLTGLFDEVSWYATPASRDAKAAVLKERAEEALLEAEEEEGQEL